MLYNKLSKSDLEVSRLCLGTMTFGQQNTPSQGHAQIEYALDQGINFIDTAEMYAVPGNPKTQGATERIIGSWLAKSKKRADIILASKITGPNPSLSYIRENLNYSSTQIRTALEGNLSRLNTDYLDLYQLHWPERKTNFFGKRDYLHDTSDQWQDNIAEVITVLNELIEEGKIRHYGISNETAWGASKFIKEAEKLNLKAPLTIQNPYSLLNRTFEIGLAEVSMREGIDLLAYSPLAFGVLSGKYLKGQTPKNSRLDLFPQFSRYSNELALKATAKYAEIAASLNVSLTQLALAFSFQQPFVKSSIIGATTMEQLKENMACIHLDISPEIREELNKVHDLIPNPAP